MATYPQTVAAVVASLSHKNTRLLNKQNIQIPLARATPFLSKLYKLRGKGDVFATPASVTVKWVLASVSFYVRPRDLTTQT